MELTQLANLGEFIGGVAVLVTLIYLAVQVGGSKKALKTQTHHNFLAMGQRPLELLIADADLADIVTRGHEDPETLNEPEWKRYSSYVFLMFNAWEYGYYLHKSGSTPPELWEGGNAYFGSLAATKRGCQKFWQETSHGFAEPFHSFAESHFPAAAEQRTSP